MLAPEGRCRTLDAAASGYVRAEAVGGLRMRLISLVAGLELGGGDVRPHALLHGAALNQDGRSSSLTAPSGRAQQALLCAALAAAHMAPSAVRCPPGQEAMGLCVLIVICKPPEVLLPGRPLQQLSSERCRAVSSLYALQLF